MSKQLFACPYCREIHKIPTVTKKLEITCMDCGKIFYVNPSNPQIKKTIKRPWIPGIIITVILAFILYNIDFTSDGVKSVFSKAKSSNWITIAYGDLVNKSTLTHSEDTVAEIIRKIPQYTDDLKGQVQEYLEPFSLLCHDVLLTTIKPDSLPFINILAHYPVGSEQPAWVDLFREGHYQLYYNSNIIRVFLKGTNAKNSYKKYHSVIRHPIRDIVNNLNTSIDNIEIYVFNNNYATTELKLNTIPEIYTIDELDLLPKGKPIDLTSIIDFLNQGVILEAIEVDDNNELYFYGRKSSKQTLAGSPLTLSDIAVIYRSIFHFGNNAPYISLDQHEDNRFAKVNFGGHLNNTHAGSVVLEADKLFKALSTGIDPNTHKLIKSKITKEVPDFLTEDERSLQDDSIEGEVQIRYWFYPDSIGTVTDGSIGVVLTNQFLADVERMDVKVNASNATKKTINHLNNNFNQYERALKTFEELRNVGRIMALVNWLKGMNIDSRIELDALLSVKIPAFKTPKKTKKMLAVTGGAFPKYLNNENIRSYTKVYYLSNLLDQHRPSTSDKTFISVAGDYFTNINISKIATPTYNSLQSSIDYYDRLIRSDKQKIESLGNELDRNKYTIDKYDSQEIDDYNDKIKQYNRLLEIQETNINIYNTKIEQQNNMHITRRSIVSIGGGINLRPKEFKKISRNRNSPKIREIKKIKSTIKTVGNISKSGNWIRSKASGVKGSNINKLPINLWISSKSVNGGQEYTYKSKSGDYASTYLYNEMNDWQYETVINGNKDIVESFKISNQVQVTHSYFNDSYIGRISSNGKRVDFFDLPTKVRMYLPREIKTLKRKKF